MFLALRRGSSFAAFFLFSFSAILWSESRSVSGEKFFLDSIETSFGEDPSLLSDGFDFPVGAPNANGYVDKQPFGKNFHLGEDWNAVGRNDFGDPVYSVSHGVVVSVGNEGPGWGTVLQIVHKLPDGKKILSLYAHLSRSFVVPGQRVRRGKKIGNIGDADGRYGPHLHFEMRDDVSLPVGGGYGKITDGYLDPKAFIRAHRRIKRK
ncbi:M23 family metallopeptidase [Leptospira gomenensis]|uniref:M23 family metallopeptidase n=1 Tax=Leptospira gomenensis TaxID=2484974 RepID=A0A5F1Z0T1_9LEPT|nr:M23 family metallopeptidase [Leptospira gomenensis]TGK41738.1 M23 family metallopeptidase [Leptospira gomenensis]TGK45306.1 M23 family metallopeptidase [Leptospira gomenensis]TGK66219.1 M23 family metallopeptidase [Leptospira gomenensis]